MREQVLKEARCLACYKVFNREQVENANEFSGNCSLECSILNWQRYADVPDSLRATDLSRINLPAQVAEIQKWMKQRERFISGAIPGLLLHGVESGTGKTRLATYAISHLVGLQWLGEVEERYGTLEDGCCDRGLWFNCARFKSKYLEVHRDGEARGIWSQTLTEADVLLLDDVDKIKPSDGLLELLFAVLDDRLTDGKTTILTTNLTGETLERRWGDEVGPYLVRRLRDYCMCLDFDV